MKLNETPAMASGREHHICSDSMPASAVRGEVNQLAIENARQRRELDFVRALVSF
jgi:hypothetical protein